MTTVEEAMEIAKRIIAKMKGLDKPFAGVPMIDFCDFSVDKINIVNENYELIVEFNSALLSTIRLKFLVKINVDTGEVLDVENVTTN